MKFGKKAEKHPRQVNKPSEGEHIYSHTGGENRQTVKTVKYYCGHMFCNSLQIIPTVLLGIITKLDGFHALKTPRF